MVRKHRIPSYEEHSSKIQGTNDCAERSVKLITDFNNTVTKTSQGTQHLLQIVEHHRKTFPSTTKLMTNQ